MAASHRHLRRTLRRLAGDDGAAAVSFILTFPIFMLIVAIIVQLALMVTAKIAVSHAADTAARAAMTSLPDERPDNVARAAWLSLAPISPEAEAATPEGAEVAEALRQVGTSVPDSFAARYAYAMAATEVSWTPERSFEGAEGAPVEIDVTYHFRLTVPFAMRIVPAVESPISGVNGRFWRVSAQRRVQASHGRKVDFDVDRWDSGY